MPSKGPSGNTTTTTINPTQQAQLPFLTQGWNQAKNLYEDIGGPRYFPGQTMAPYTAPSNYLNQGYQGLVDTARANDTGFRPAANNAWMDSLTKSGVQNSPIYNRMVALAEGTDADQTNLRNQAGQAIASGNQYAQNLAGGNLGLSTLGNIAQGQGAGMEQLAKTASGAFLNSNPYLDKMAQAAMDPVTRNYQTSTAPTLASQMARAGRYGSGAFTGVQGQNEQNLGKTLGDISTNLYGTNYANERARQDAAANQYAGLQAQAGANYGQQYGANQTNAANASMAGYNAAGQDLGRTLLAQTAGAGTLQSGYQAGNDDRTAALQQYPGMLNSQYNAANQLVQAGQGFTGINDTLQQQAQAGINDAMNRYNAQQMEPFKDLSMYLQNIGQPTTGSSSTTQPYFQNSLASTLSGLTGLKSLLGGTGGLAGLGGASSALSSALAGDAALTAAGVPTLTAGLAGPVTAAAGAEAAGGGGLLSGIGAALSKL